ncbi:VOC family protein [Patescibacteria group bacterium]|nr:VOC family protein [Patescibacteria group bacterium]
MKPKISLITLGVNDLARSKKFYSEGLGFPVEGNDEGIIFLKLEGVWLSLYPREKLAEDSLQSPIGSGFAGITLAHNVSSQIEVDQVVDQAVRAGATLIKKPQPVFWGGYSGYFADPDGHLWEIAHNPFMDLT